MHEAAGLYGRELVFKEKKQIKFFKILSFRGSVVNLTMKLRLKAILSSFNGIFFCILGLGGGVSLKVEILPGKTEKLLYFHRQL